MSDNVDVGGVPTKTLDSGGYHVQYYILLGPDAPSVFAVPADSSETVLAAALAAPLVRRRLTVVNASDTYLYIKYELGVIAGNAGLYSYPIPPGQTWEMPDPAYSGVIVGVWDLTAGGAEPTGNAMVTELKSSGTLP